MKKTIGILLSLFAFLYSEAQITLSTDFVNESYKKDALYNIWTVANRISPENGVNVREAIEVNTVRMIGGIKKKVNGENVPYLDYDPCRYDSVTNKYIYNWVPLKSRIDAILKSGTRILQIVLDQPPWAFQYGYSFIPEGTCDSIHFREDERMTSYGNSLPPCDKRAYFEFIQALMKELVSIYGQSVVESWRFRVGSEIETPDHWKGTRQDFIDHFANTEKGVRSILPKAKVGIHTRAPGFLYKKGTVLNYKGEPIASFAKDLIEYCYDNNVKYDFWGISDYVLINDADVRDVSKKYDELFASLVSHPKWNHKATLDIMEYSVVISMSAPDGGVFLNCASSHAELINLGFSTMFYKNQASGLNKIFRWGQITNSIDPPGIEVLNTMIGKIRFETEVSGNPTVSGNQLDAIFAKGEKDEIFDVLLYNINGSSLNYENEEPVIISFATALPIGVKVLYRNLLYGKEQNNLQNFLKNEPPLGWVKKGWDRNGDPSRILNESGLTAWKLYENPNSYKFSDWRSITTVARSDGGKGSLIKIKTQIPSFAFKKYEFIIADK